jgi:diadenosine tetraphosphate (Ap4A) HIT family hydrolase
VTEAAGCLLCGMEQADEQAVVFRDQQWAAEVVPGYEVPGWFILRARRHAERITGLDHDELSTLAWRARDLVAAVTGVTGAPATYLMVFGENYPHFHVLVAARGEEVPPELRTGNILLLRAGHADREAALKLVPAVRAAYRGNDAGELCP